jgi:hypothetical protein
MRMAEIAEILSDFNAKRDPNMARKDYLSELK